MESNKNNPRRTRQAAIREGNLQAEQNRKNDNKTTHFVTMYVYLSKLSLNWPALRCSSWTRKYTPDATNATATESKF